MVDAFAPGGWFAANWLLWTGVEPVTSRVMVWCSTSELPIDAPVQNPVLEHASITVEITDRARRWSKRRQPRLLSKRRRWESNPLECCFAGSRRTVWLQRQSSVLARNRTWTSTFAGLHAHPAHPEDVNLVAARRGVEPRLAVSKTAVRSGTLAGRVISIPTWI